MRSLCYFLTVLLVTFQSIAAYHNIEFGPIAYALFRNREKGTSQTAAMLGGNILYQRIQPNGLFYGAEGYLAYGNLKGEGKRMHSLYSNVREGEIQGRIGGSFFWNCPCRVLFTPYAGYGYFCGVNHFVSPSPFRMRFQESYNYASLGFYVNCRLTNCFYSGFHIQTKFPSNCKCKISDHDFGSIDLDFEGNPIFLAEVPITYVFGGCNNWGFTVTPFYQYKMYGGRENFPFDYLRTTYQQVGAKFNFSFWF